MALDTEEGGNFQLDQLLQAMAGKFGDQLTGAVLQSSSKASSGAA